MVASGNRWRRGRATRGFSTTAHGAQRRVFDGRVILGREGEFDEAEEVLEHFRVPLDAALPVFVDSSLECLLGLGDLTRVRRGAVVVKGSPRYGFHVLGMGGLPPLGQHVEIL